MVGESARHRPAVSRLRKAAAGVVAFAVGAGAVLMVSTVGTAGAPLDEPLDHTQLVATAVAGTMRLSARGCGQRSIGTGVVVVHDGDVLLVTNRHLVEGALDAKIDQGGTGRFRPVVARSENVDLALVQPAGGLPIALAANDPAAGDEITLAGHGGGGELRVADAAVHIVTDGAAYGIAGPVLLIDAPTVEGFSGGPVLDHRGRLVGLLMGYEPNLRLTLALPVSAVRSFLDAPGTSEASAVCP